MHAVHDHFMEEFIMEYRDVNGRMCNAHIGDRVIVTYLDSKYLGTVRCMMRNLLGVEFDEDVPEGHSLHSILELGSRRGRYVPPNSLIFTGERKPIEHACDFCNSHGLNYEIIGERVACPDCVNNIPVVCEQCESIVPHRRTIMVNGKRFCLDCHLYCNDVCIHCGTIAARNEYTVDGRTVCRNCFDSHTFICDHCGERHFNDDKKIFDGKALCNHCILTQYPICSLCQTRHHVSETVSMQGLRNTTRNVCMSCMENLPICDDCGKKMHPEMTTYTADGRLVCTSCISERYFFCNGCHWCHLESGEHAYALDDDGYACRICSSCAGNLTPCEDCGMLILHGCGHSVCVNGVHKTVCSRCRCEYNECSHCGSVGVDFHCNRFGNKFCPECWTKRKTGLLNAIGADEESWRAPAGIAKYVYKPDPIFFPRVDYENPIYTGIELEVDADSDRLSMNDLKEIAAEVNRILGYTYIKADGSLDNGFEIVTHPAQLEYHTRTKREAWIKAMDYMRRRGLTGHANGNAGLHVHVSIAPLEYCCEDGVEKMIYLWSKHWDKLVLFSRRNTSDSWAMHWAQKLYSGVDDGMSTSRAMDALKSVKDSTLADTRHESRYRAINLQNEHTLELRLFRSTLLPDTFFATLQLVEVMVRAVMKHSFAELREMSWEQLTASEYPELNAYLEDRQRVDPDCQNWIDEDDDSMPDDVIHINRREFSDEPEEEEYFDENAFCCLSSAA